MHCGYVRCLAVTVISYLALYSAFLWHCGGFPYVCDNNETYSALWHAHNLYHYPFWQTHGVTDEACSPHEAAHPYFYTHEGNFPRVFALALYVLGARSPQSQIVITTLTMGLGTIILGFHFFSRRVNAGFACITMLFLMTDYVLFMQWQVVTFRCWHFFFFFASLLCVDYAETGRRLWMVATGLTFLCLFYYEPVFVVFLTLTCFGYACFRLGSRWRLLGRLSLVAGGGAAFAVVIFLGQLFLTFGPDIVGNDIYCTILARQYGGGSEAESARIMETFADRNILFLANFTNGSGLKTARMFAFMVMYLHCTPYTALVAASALLLIGGIVLAVVIQRLAPMLTILVRSWAFWDWVNSKPRSVAIAAAAVLSITTMKSVGIVLSDIAHHAEYTVSTAGIPNSTRRLLAVCAGVLVFLISFLAARRSRYRPADFLIRAALAAMLLMGGSRAFDKLSRYQEGLSFAVVGTGAWQWVAIVGLVLAAAIVAWLIVAGASRALQDVVRQFIPLVPFVLAVALAYAAAFVLFTGYIKTGYHDRWLSMLIPCTILLPATACYLLVQLLADRTRRVFRCVRIASRRRSEERAIRGDFGGVVLSSRLSCAISAIVLFLFVAAWARVQHVHFSFLSPDQFEFLTRLNQAPYAGASFVTASYASPVAWGTGQWAYADPTFTPGNVQLTESGYVLQRNLRYGLWLGDWKTNAAYVRPDYLAAVRYQSLDSENARILAAFRHTPNGPKLLDLCGLHGPNLMGSEVVESDPSGLRRWALIKLNWNYPPYLERLGYLDSDRVRLHYNGNGTAVVEYHYRHQEGVPEAGSRIRLHLVDAEGQRLLLKENVHERTFQVPTGLTGNLQASVVPCNKDKQGEEFFSNFIPVGGAPSRVPPELKPLRQDAGPYCVRATLTGRCIDVEYEYCHAHGEPERRSLIRLYLETDDGQCRLLSEAVGTRSILIPDPVAASGVTGVLRVGVIPRTAQAQGREYLGSQKIPMVSSPFQDWGPSPGIRRDEHRPLKIERQTDGITIMLTAVIMPLPETEVTFKLQALTREGTFVTVRQTRHFNVLLVKPDEYEAVRVVAAFEDPEGKRHELVGPLITDLRTNHGDVRP